MAKAVEQPGDFRFLTPNDHIEAQLLQQTGPGRPAQALSQSGQGPVEEREFAPSQASGRGYAKFFNGIGTTEN
jgi:hypothetical protein